MHWEHTFKNNALLASIRQLRREKCSVSVLDNNITRLFKTIDENSDIKDLLRAVLSEEEFSSRKFPEFQELRLIVSITEKHDFSLFYEVLDRAFVEPLLYFLVKDTYISLYIVYTHLDRMMNSLFLEIKPPSL